MRARTLFLTSAFIFTFVIHYQIIETDNQYLVSMHPQSRDFKAIYFWLGYYLIVSDCCYGERVEDWEESTFRSSHIPGKEENWGYVHHHLAVPGSQTLPIALRQLYGWPAHLGLHARVASILFGALSKELRADGGDWGSCSVLHQQEISPRRLGGRVRFNKCSTAASKRGTWLRIVQQKASKDTLIHWGFLPSHAVLLRLAWLHQVWVEV